MPTQAMILSKRSSHDGVTGLMRNGFSAHDFTA
jgi:hypothetical protein